MEKQKGSKIMVILWVVAVIAAIAAVPTVAILTYDTGVVALEPEAEPPEETAPPDEQATEPPPEEPAYYPTPDIREFLHNNPVPPGFVADNAALPWSLTLLNRYNFLNEDFVVPEAVSVGDGHYFDSRAAASLLEMLDAAREEGLVPIIASATRSIERQRILFENQIARNIEAGMNSEDAFEQARRVVAYPGSSEHNLGLGVDIVAYHYRNLTAAFGQTPEGIWLAQNAHNFGFVLRYPDHKQEITNIIYEPWHFRYVGAQHSIFMFENDVVLEEYVFWRLHGYDEITP
ncbi:MAG: M15 family metallopeptidase [Clostridiales bacterium]|jgi:LAS superfamily LD-carboxypeptidase LdcB|nr:M15 family metallopeptidase [Clostridiales bacterium]